MPERPTDRPAICLAVPAHEATDLPFRSTPRLPHHPLILQKARLPNVFCDAMAATADKSLRHNVDCESKSGLGSPPPENCAIWRALMAAKAAGNRGTKYHSRPNDQLDAIMSRIQTDRQKAHPLAAPDDLPEDFPRSSLEPTAPSVASNDAKAPAPPAAETRELESPGEEVEVEESPRPQVRYKPAPRMEENYRSYSVSLSDRQYDQILSIRFAEMQRLKRSNISIAQVIRELIDVGLENTKGTRLFADPRRGSRR